MSDGPPILPSAAYQPWREWYGLGIWKRLRAAQLRKEPLCRFCLARKVVTPATIADHVVSHEGNWNAFRLGELQSLCKPCHDREKRVLDERGYAPDVDADGWPTDPRHPANAKR